MTQFNFRVRVNKYYYRQIEITMPTACKKKAVEKAELSAKLLYGKYLKLEIQSIKSE